MPGTRNHLKFLDLKVLLLQVSTFWALTFLLLNRFNESLNISTYIQKTARLTDKSGGSNTPGGTYDLLKRNQGAPGEGPIFKRSKAPPGVLEPPDLSANLAVF